MMFVHLFGFNLPIIMLIFTINRTDPKRLAVAFRVAASVVVFAAVLFVVASR